MSEEKSLVRRQLEESLTNTVEELLNGDDVVMLLIDCSSSMDTKMKNRKTRIDGLKEVVAGIKAQGHVPMIAFGGPFDAQVRFVDGVPEPDGGTPLHLAIPFAKEYGATRLVVISDGEPDLREQCLIEARNFNGRIDVAFVGDPGDGGEYFPGELATLTGGTSFTGDLTDPKKLTSGVIGLLEGEVEPVKAPIQGPGFTTVEDPDDIEDAEEDEDDEEDDDE